MERIGMVRRILSNSLELDLPPRAWLDLQHEQFPQFSLVLGPIRWMVLDKPFCLPLSLQGLERGVVFFPAELSFAEEILRLWGRSMGGCGVAQFAKFLLLQKVGG